MTHPRGCKGEPSDLGDLRGFLLPLALPVHQEGMHERQQSQQHQDQVHLEGEGAVRPSSPPCKAQNPTWFLLCVPLRPDGALCNGLRVTFRSAPLGQGKEVRCAHLTGGETEACRVPDDLGGHAR